ncbi:MAG: Uma2 family endonuclease [Planctomycetes bacterium]|nr:Uma2 family endonuclease [Planctomycetota bacterium]
MNLVTRPETTAAPPGNERRGGEQRLLLHCISWDEYVALGEILKDRPALRMTYDRGNLEFMTTSPEHERLKKRLSRVLEALAEEFGREIATAGNMTFRREDLDRGLEPDDCFWIAHEAQVRTRQDWDPTRDPPPDLILEIEISRSALNRLGIYAALRVPEVWRCDGERFHIHVLQSTGEYQEVEASPTFPGIPVAEIIPFLQENETRGYLGMIRAFHEWVRQHLPKP